MRRAALLFSTVVVGAALVWLAPACLEITPIIVEKDSALPADAGCVSCLELPDRCGFIIVKCNGDPRCVPVYACITRERCFDLPTIDDKITCGLPCAADAGITRLNDPFVDEYLVSLLACAREKCAVPCNLSDEAGPGL